MASYDHYNDSDALPFRFLDRVNSPEKLTAYFASIDTSDIAATGVDRTFEFNESLSDLMRLILRDRPKSYPWDPRLKQTITNLILHRFRNPESGWWGTRYVRGGGTKFVDDLSITFHVVSYLEGNVPDLSRIIDTALALKDVDTPAGVLWQGAYWNHNNMGLAVIFRMPSRTPRAAAQEATTIGEFWRSSNSRAADAPAHFFAASSSTLTGRAPATITSASCRASRRIS
jgi:hypothetical protein